MFTPLYITFSRIIKANKILWVIPFILFFLFVLSKLVSFLYINSPYIQFFSLSAVLVLSIILLLWGFLIIVLSVFKQGDVLKNEIILYRRLGFSLITQYSLFYIFIICTASLMYLYVATLLWDYNFKFLLISMIFAGFMMFIKTISLVLRFNFIFYILFPVFFVPVLAPIYLLPNYAYIINGDTMGTIIYSVVYLLFYYIISFRFYIYAWRKECIGWI